jgi:hypothetical protein
MLTRDRCARTQFPTQLQRAGHGVRRFDGRDDALTAAQQRERIHRLGICDGAVLGAPDVAEIRVLGSDTRVVEAGRDRVRLDGLTVFVLQQVRVGALEGSRAYRRSNVAACLPVSTPSPAAS